MTFFVFLFWGLCAMFVHEAGHIIMGSFVGVPAKQLGFKWWAGAFTVRPYADKRWKNVLITLAGPTFNLIVCFLCLVRRGDVLWAEANCFIGVINLLPFKGSDGYRLLSYVKNKVQETTTKAA